MQICVVLLADHPHCVKSFISRLHDGDPSSIRLQCYISCLFPFRSLHHLPVYGFMLMLLLPHSIPTFCSHERCFLEGFTPRYQQLVGTDVWVDWRSVAYGCYQPPMTTGGSAGLTLTTTLTAAKGTLLIMVCPERGSIWLAYSMEPCFHV